MPYESISEDEYLNMGKNIKNENIGQMILEKQTEKYYNNEARIVKKL